MPGHPKRKEILMLCAVSPSAVTAVLLPLLIAGAYVALIGLILVIRGFRLRAVTRKGRRRRLAEWTALAQPRGFEVDALAGEVTMRGKVGSRPFEMDHDNCFTYGMDRELCLRLRVDDEDAAFSVITWDANFLHGELQPPRGDQAFDASFRVRANAPGLRYLGRFGADERKLLVDHPELFVLQWKGQAWIRLPYRLDARHLDAACHLLARLWGDTSDEPHT